MTNDPTRIVTITARATFQGWTIWEKGSGKNIRTRVPFPLLYVDKHDFDFSRSQNPKGQQPWNNDIQWQCPQLGTDGGAAQHHVPTATEMWRNPSQKPNPTTSSMQSYPQITPCVRSNSSISWSNSAPTSSKGCCSSALHPWM